MSDQHTMKSFNDQFQLNLQRLADGELSASAKHDFLHGIDKHAPDQWRDVALTLLEQRLWNTQLNSPGIIQSSPKAAVTRPAKPAAPQPTRRSLATHTSYILASCCLGLIAGLLIPINYGSQPLQHTTMRNMSPDNGIGSMQASNGQPNVNQSNRSQPNKQAEQILVNDTDRIAIEILENLARQGYRIDTQNYQLTDQYNNPNANPELTSFVAYPSGL